MQSAGNAVEIAALDPMDQPRRFARGGDQVIPSASTHGRSNPQHTVCDRVPMMMIVKKPSIEIGLAKFGLNRVEVHGGFSQFFLRAPGPSCWAKRSICC